MINPELDRVSWRTGDTGEPVWNSLTKYCKPVYLLLPKGDKVKEDNYLGFGQFGELNAFEWLAEMNAPGLCTARKEHNVLLGQAIAGFPRHDFFRDELSGKIYSRRFHWIFDEVEKPDSDIEHFTPIDYIGEWLGINIAFPLKLSFDPNATYESIGSSHLAENNGSSGDPEHDRRYMEEKAYLEEWLKRNRSKKIAFAIRELSGERKIIRDGKIYDVSLSYNHLRSKIRVLGEDNILYGFSRKKLEHVCPSLTA